MDEFNPLMYLFDHSEEIAGAFAHNSFYHVTSKEQAKEIARTGLLPAKETGRTNYPDLVVSPDHVYLWPNIGSAQSSIDANDQKFDDDEHVLLKVSVPDLSLLAPDHEQALRLLSEDADSYEQIAALIAEMQQSGLASEIEEIRSTQNDRDLDSQERFFTGGERTLELLEQMDPLLRLRFAHEVARLGEAVMYNGAVPVEMIEVAEISEIERLSERFGELHPELLPRWDDDGEIFDAQQERYDEAFDDWLVEEGISPAEASDLDDYRRRMHDPMELVDAGDDALYLFTPIAEHWQFRSPWLHDLADAPAPADAAPGFDGDGLGH